MRLNRNTTRAFLEWLDMVSVVGQGHYNVILAVSNDSGVTAQARSLARIALSVAEGRAPCMDCHGLGCARAVNLPCDMSP